MMFDAVKDGCMSIGEWNAIRLSLLVATTAVISSFPLALMMGWILARKSFRGKFILDAVVNLPLVLPPVVTGYALLITLGNHGMLGRALQRWFGWHFVFNWKGAAVAAAVVAFPLFVRPLRLAFLSVDQRLEQAARTLGAKRWDVFVTVTLPLAMPGIMTGCLLAFARALGEFGATIMIAGNIPGQTQTIPLFIYQQLETPGGFEHSRAVIGCSIVLSVAAMVLTGWLEQRGQLQRRHGASLRS